MTKRLAACKMALLCRLDNISRAVRACSATSMNWITWSCRQEGGTRRYHIKVHQSESTSDYGQMRKPHLTFSRKTGIASTTTAEDRGSASIIYVSAREAWFICGRSNIPVVLQKWMNQTKGQLQFRQLIILTISKLCSICNSVICERMLRGQRQNYN